MDRRSFLGLLGGFAAAATLLQTSPGEAMPAASRTDIAPAGPEPAVALDADMEAAQAEKAYWIVYRRRRWRRRRYWRRRYYIRRYYIRRVYRRRWW